MDFPLHASVPHESAWGKLCHEHQRLDAVLSDVEYLAEDRSFSTAAKRFGEFRLHQEQHIREEEQLLRLLERLPGPPQIVDELRREHEQFRELLDDAAVALACRDPRRFANKLTALHQALAAHQDAQRALLLPELEAKFQDEDAYQKLLLTMDSH